MKIATRPTHRNDSKSLLHLMKPGLGLWVLFATAIGYFLANEGAIQGGRLAAALLGTALVSGGSAALNQSFEAHRDRMMLRTRNRPLPAGRLTSRTAFLFGAGLAGCGLAALLLFTTAEAAGFAAAALVIYLAAYTPLKRRTPACVFVGAVAGALPPVIGWAAAGGPLGLQASLLFSILFFWQMPHLLAIAWRYRDEYRAAGFVLLGQQDASGRRAAGMAVGFTLVLWALTQDTAVACGTGPVGFFAMLVCNGALMAAALLFLQTPSRRNACWLFRATIAHLPLVLGILYLL